LNEEDGMPVGHVDEIPGTSLSGDDMQDVVKKVLVGPADGWEDWVMRLFELGPRGHTPRHAHAWPHINVILAGEGTLLLGGAERPLRAGSFAFVPAAQTHQFRNTGTEELKIVCIVPREGDV
jgi:quercetin dioxygenase-like cupin family protein